MSHMEIYHVMHHTHIKTQIHKHALSHTHTHPDGTMNRTGDFFKL